MKLMYLLCCWWIFSIEIIVIVSWASWLYTQTSKVNWGEHVIQPFHLYTYTIRRIASSGGDWWILDYKNYFKIQWFKYSARWKHSSFSQKLSLSYVIPLCGFWAVAVVFWFGSHTRMFITFVLQLHVLTTFTCYSFAHIHYFVHFIKYINSWQ